jgi:hypothetical protein
MAKLVHSFFAAAIVIAPSCGIGRTGSLRLTERTSGADVSMPRDRSAVSPARGQPSRPVSSAHRASREKHRGSPIRARIAYG